MCKSGVHQERCAMPHICLAMQTLALHVLCIVVIRGGHALPSCRMKKLYLVYVQFGCLLGVGESHEAHVWMPKHLNLCCMARNMDSRSCMATSYQTVPTTSYSEPSTSYSHTDCMKTDCMWSLCRRADLFLADMADMAIHVYTKSMYVYVYVVCAENICIHAYAQ